MWSPAPNPVVLSLLEVLQIEQEMDGWKIRIVPLRENTMLWRASECSGRGEVREAFLEGMEFKDGLDL